MQLLGNFHIDIVLRLVMEEKSLIAYKGDVGRGSVEYRPQIDLHKKVADALGFKGRGEVKIKFLYWN